jgi:hypothetical protein
MNRYWNIEFLGEGKVGLVFQVAETETSVLSGHFSQHAARRLAKRATSRHSGDELLAISAGGDGIR